MSKIGLEPSQQDVLGELGLGTAPGCSSSEKAGTGCVGTRMDIVRFRGDVLMSLIGGAVLAVVLLAHDASPAYAEAVGDGQSIISTLESAVETAGPWAPVVFVVCYVIAAVIFVPASALTIAAGFLFGPVQGSLMVSLASTTGAAVSFLIGRYIARPFVEKKLASSSASSKFAAVDKAIREQGAKVVFLLRLSPLFPYSPLNYLLSLTSVRFLDFLGASWLGMIPGTIAYVALGGVGKAATENTASPVQIVFYVVGAAATLAVTVILGRVARKALNDDVDDSTEG